MANCGAEELGWSWFLHGTVQFSEEYRGKPPKKNNNWERVKDFAKKKVDMQIDF